MPAQLSSPISAIYFSSEAGESAAPESTTPGALTERERFRMPSFGHYFVFAFTTMLPAHLIVTAALWWLDR